jgi:RNA polymerase sigma-70 factor (ECF subfamily)
MLQGPELAELIKRTAQRDREAFRALYEATSSLLMGIALKVLERHDLAEEAVQDSYVAIWRQASKFDVARGSARGWISVITRRRAVDRLRASPWLQREIPEEAEVSASIQRLPEAMTLRHCLSQLDDATRHAICLAYLYGMTHSELSSKTGTPLGTMKSRLRRGLHSLRECLGL